MAGSRTDSLGEEGPPYHCVKHANVETLIRCSKCLDPICQECAVPTPVGLRCHSCAYANRSPLYTVRSSHLLVAAGTGLVLAIVAGAAAVQLGVLWTALLSGAVGGGIAEMMQRVTRGKRGRAMQIVAVACIVLGALLGPIAWALVRSGGGGGAFSGFGILGLFLDLRVLAFAVLGSLAAFARLS